MSGHLVPPVIATGWPYGFVRKPSWLRNPTAFHNDAPSERSGKRDFVPAFLRDRRMVVELVIFDLHVERPEIDAVIVPIGHHVAELPDIQIAIVI
jgi:hypothetical protein